MKKLNACPLCENIILNNFIKCTDYSVSKEVFQIVKCSKCTFAFTNPRPDNDKLGSYYLSENYISHTNNSKGLFNSLYQIIRRISINSKLLLLNKYSTKGSILDIGCGTGEFLNFCKKNNWITKGVEPSSLARKQAITNFNLSVSDNTTLNEFEKNSFNVITMWHVLEHVPNIQQTLNMTNQLLKKDGVLFLALPNLNSFDANYYAHFWAGYDVPIHLWHFSKKTISLLLESHGFKLIQTKPLIFDSFYVSMISEKYKNKKMSFIKGLFIGALSNLYGMFTGSGYSSHIYIFRKN